MEKLTYQLKRNTQTIKLLKERYLITDVNTYYSVFSDEEDKRNDLKKILKLQQRVLRMRYDILENIRIEALKQIHDLDQHGIDYMCEEFSNEENCN